MSGYNNQHEKHSRLPSRRAVAMLLVTMIGLSTQAAVNPAALPVIPQQTFEIENATNIKAQPLALLAKFPDAGPQMARFVADQLVQQPGAVDAMLSILNDTSPAQASAMGAGMVRAARQLSAKNPAAARMISEKVMRADNKYLTTTYASLGPRYPGNVPFSAPASLPPREYVAGDIGFGMGAGWRVGPAENGNRTAIEDANSNPTVVENCLYDTNSLHDEHCRGMIVAIIKSDASSNGAVSTSPTI